MSHRSSSPPPTSSTSTSSSIHWSTQNSNLYSPDQQLSIRRSPQPSHTWMNLPPSSSSSMPSMAPSSETLPTPPPFSSSFMDALEYETNQRQFSDFSTLDWSHPSHSNRTHRTSPYGFSFTSSSSFLDILQAWGSVTLLGVVIGCSVAWSDVVFDWLYDLKFGFCASSFYLNKKKCCWEQWDEEGSCPDWQEWSYEFLMLRYFPPINFVVYVLFSSLMAAISSFLVISYAPEYSAQSGIAEVKTILGGFVMKKALSFKTGVIKWISLVYCMASGLSIGNKAPLVHIAACIANTLTKWFPKYRNNEAAKNHFISCACAAGMAAAFGSPIGGILFALEEVSTFFPIPVMWMAFMCSLWATLMLQILNPFNTGSMVAFQVSHPHEWHLFELAPFSVLGLLGGLLGALFTKLSIRIQLARRRSEFCQNHPILDPTYLAFVTAFFGYWSSLTRYVKRDHILSLLAGLFKDCDGNENYHGICNSSAFLNLVSLVYALVLRFTSSLLTYGAKVPSGIFLPCMAMGACLGRIVGIIVSTFQNYASTWPIFASCQIGDKDCVAPGSYALLGAAAALTGATRMTISIVVILFELTGALHFVLPTIVVVVVAKFISDFIVGKEGYSTLMVQLNNYPFLENRQDYNFSMCADRLMSSQDLVLFKNGMTVKEIQSILNRVSFNTFPIVNDMYVRGLEGCISRRDLLLGLAQSQSETQFVYFHSPVLASLSSQTSSSTSFPSVPILDLRSYTDQTPLAVHPRCNLSFVYQLFLKLGLRYVFVKHKGKLIGLITKKDMIRFTNAAQGTYLHMDHARHHVFALDPMIDRHQAWYRRLFQQLQVKLKVWLSNTFFSSNSSSSSSSSSSTTSIRNLFVEQDLDEESNMLPMSNLKNNNFSSNVNSSSSSSST